MADEEDEEAPPPYMYEGPREAGLKTTLSVEMPVDEEADPPVTKTRTKEISLLGARSGEWAGGDAATPKATFPNGDVYTGSYVQGVRAGAGKYVYSGGKPAEEGDDPPPPSAVYEGTWKKNSKSGLGVMQYAPMPGGAKYHGNWRGGKRNGQGTFFYANGDIYSGEWVDGKKQGEGSYLYKASGAEMVGTWKNGVMLSGSFIDKHGGNYKGSFAGDAKNVSFVAGGVFTAASGATAIAA